MELDAGKLGYRPGVSTHHEHLERNARRADRAREYEEQRPRQLGMVAARFGSSPPGGSSQEEIPVALQQALNYRQADELPYRPEAGGPDAPSN